MFKNLKNKLKKNFEIFGLITVIFITTISTSYYNHKKNLSNETYNNFVDNVYFKKTLKHLVENLDPKYKKINGIEFLDKVIDIDQSPIGRTPRSNPATYTGAFSPIREWFSGLPESKVRGYSPGRFSFNVRGGRCEACKGDGLIKIEICLKIII